MIVLGLNNVATPHLYLPSQKDYFCRECKASGVKLWRESSTFCIKLICETCMTGGNVFNRDGLMLGPYGLTDQYSNSSGIRFVPAIPTEEGDGYYWYTSAPELACQWWKKLPLHQ